MTRNKFDEFGLPDFFDQLIKLRICDDISTVFLKASESALEVIPLCRGSIHCGSRHSFIAILRPSETDAPIASAKQYTLLQISVL